MNILLASVSFTTPYTFQQRFLALGYLHAIAATDEVIGPRTHITHEYFDPSLHGPEELARQMLEHAPDLVGLTCYVWNTFDVLRVCACLKALSPNTRILLGGPEVSYGAARAACGTCRRPRGRRAGCACSGSAP